MIRIENLVKRYGDVVALDHFNLDVKEGEIFGLSRSQWFRKDDGDQLYACTFKV